MMPGGVPRIEIGWISFPHRAPDRSAVILKPHTPEHQRLPDMKPGQKSSITFSHAGSYHYQCHYHPQNMKGDVVVS